MPGTGNDWNSSQAEVARCWNQAGAPSTQAAEARELNEETEADEPGMADWRGFTVAVDVIGDSCRGAQWRLRAERGRQHHSPMPPCGIGSAAAGETGRPNSR